MNSLIQCSVSGDNEIQSSVSGEGLTDQWRHRLSSQMSIDNEKTNKMDKQRKNESKKIDDKQTNLLCQFINSLFLGHTMVLSAAILAFQQ